MQTPYSIKALAIIVLGHTINNLIVMLIELPIILILGFDIAKSIEMIL